MSSKDPPALMPTIEEWVKDEIKSKTEFTRLKTAYTVGRILGGALVGATLASAQEEWLRRKIARNGGSMTPAELKGQLSKLTFVRQLNEVTVTGVFFPGVLLTFGWWERPSKSAASGTVWRDKALQNWLFRGFEQWAPSWNINDLSKDENGCFVGQIGTEGGDEADAIVVVVTPGLRARALRAEFEGKVVSRATVTGRLVTYMGLIESLKKMEKHKGGDRHRRLRHHLETLEQMGIAPAYYLQVSDDPQYEVELGRKPVEYYSAYMWQCWVPKEWKDARNPAETDVNAAYFLWEHTNLADADVVRYSMDSLLRKKAFLEKRIKSDGVGGQSLSGKLSMLQHGMNESLLTRGTHKHVEPEIMGPEFLRMLQSGK